MRKLLWFYRLPRLTDTYRPISRHAVVRLALKNERNLTYSERVHMLGSLCTLVGDRVVRHPQFLLASVALAEATT